MLDTKYDRKYNIDSDVIDRLCTDVEICLSLEPEDSAYFTVVTVQEKVKELVEEYRKEFGNVIDIEAEYHATIKALGKVSRDYVTKYGNIPYELRLLFCIISRILDPRVRSYLIVQSWCMFSPDFYTLVLPTIRSAICLGDVECVKKVLNGLGQSYPYVYQVVYLYSNVKVARKAVEALARFISERYRLLSELSLDPRRILAWSKIMRVASGTAVEVPTGFGTMMTIQDMLLTQHMDLVVIGLVFSPRFMRGLSYFLDYVKILVEHSARILNEQLFRLQTQSNTPINPLRFKKLDELLAYINVLVQSVKALIRVDRIETPNLATLVSALDDLRRILFELEKEFEVNIFTLVSVICTEILVKASERAGKAEEVVEKEAE